MSTPAPTPASAAVLPSARSLRATRRNEVKKTAEATGKKESPSRKRRRERRSKARESAAAAAEAAAPRASAAAAAAAAEAATPRASAAAAAEAAAPRASAAAAAEAAAPRASAATPRASAAAAPAAVPRLSVEPTEEEIKAASAIRSATGNESYDIAKNAMTQLVEIAFPTEWWELHERGVEGRVTAQQLLRKQQHVFNKYSEQKQRSYITFMESLEAITGFVRIVTQNMHCRDRGAPGPIGLQCSAEWVFYDNQTERAIEFAKRIKSGTTKAHVFAIQELQDSNAKNAFVKQFEDNRNYKCWFPKSGTYYTSLAGKGIKSVEAGQGFVWDKTKVTLVSKEFHLFPRETSSGADVNAISGEYSFKGIAIGKFQLRNAPDVYFTVFNIHPSPYVSNDTTRSRYDFDIVATHLYQFTLLAQKMREWMSVEANRNDAVFVCGDWNVNKYFQNGFSDNGLKEEFKPENKSTLANPKSTIFARGTVKRTVKTGFFSKREFVEEQETCFRDDIPFTNNKKCDFQGCCGSEFMTVSDIIGTIPPTHLYSIAEHPLDIPAPYAGKYTWDGLLNSVMYSPYWSSRAFQMLDHITYSKYGTIPIYAHTMTKRYLTVNPVLVSEGPLSFACRHRKSIPENLQAYAVEVGRIFKSYQARYVDIADHYAVECIAVLPTSSSEANRGTIERLSKIIPVFYNDAKIWMDAFIPTVNRDAACNVSKFMIPKLWQFLSNTSRVHAINDVKEGLLRCEGHERTMEDTIAEICRKKLLEPLPTQILPNVPASNRMYKINEYVYTMANRLIEREFLNRIYFNKGLGAPFGKFSLECAKTDKTVYDCKQFTRKIRDVKDKERVMFLKAYDKGNVLEFERPTPLKSARITRPRASRNSTKKLRLAQRGLALEGPATPVELPLGDVMRTR